MEDNFSPTYFAYLVRLTRSGADDSWRVMVQDAHSDMQLRFDSLDGLVVFLKTQVGQTPPALLSQTLTDAASETIDTTETPS